MGDYEYDNPDDAYKEAQRRIKKAKDESATLLNLQKLGLTAIPSEIFQLTELRVLHLYTNQLTEVPPEIGQLTELRKLYFHNNQLTAVPPEIGKLTGLTMLNLWDNQLTAVPPEIRQLRSLRELYLGENQLTTVPSEIFQLSNLTGLALHDNQLTVIPPEIGQLTRVIKISLQNNQLTAVPPEITQLTKLVLLSLDNNPDLPIPPEIVEQRENAQAILDYLRQRQEAPAHPHNEAKLILVGQGGVGKTSLVKRLLHDDFDEAEGQTEGINIEKWELDVERTQQGTVPVSLNIWDFGGQEIMHATHQFFLTKRSLYLLVLDARQGEDEGRVEYWLSLISSFAPAAPILIIINKSDQHHLDINRRGLQEKYPAITGFVSTSARSGAGIETLKTKIAAILAEMPHVDTPFPASWMRVKTDLIEMQKSERNFLPYDEYETICRQNGIEGESGQITLVRFLHDLGIVLNFNSDDRVRDTSVLNPNWVTNGIYTLLNNRSLQQAHGLLPLKQLRRFLPDFPTLRERHFIQGMMLKFELAFALPDGNQLLIPDLISKEQPEFEWNDADALQFAYRYSVLPRSILHRFMVRQHHLLDPVIRWRTGVVLRLGSLSALVKADIKAATIRISINGGDDSGSDSIASDRRQFLYTLRLTFADIHNTIAGTKPEEVVPIPNYPDAPSVSYQYLLDLEKNGIEEMLFPHVPEKLSVQQLLNGITTPAMRQTGLPTRGEVLVALKEAFNENEFNDLLFDLKIKPGALAGDSLDSRMRELVMYAERNGRFPDLVTEIANQRPSLFADSKRPRS